MQSPFVPTGLVVTLLLSICVTAADQPDLATLAERGILATLRDGSIAELRVACDKLSDDDYRLIATMTTVTRVSFNGKNFEDRHLAMLAPLRSLASFSLNGSRLTDDGYRHFQQFPKLRQVALWHPSRRQDTFTGEGLRHFATIPSLESLTFAGATTGDAAMNALATVTQLTSYRQWHNQETAAGLANLTKLAKLKSLTLGQRLHSRDNPAPSFTGNFLANLATMTNLEQLTLQEVRLDASDLMHLKALPKLKKLTLKSVWINAAAVDQIKTELPGVTINWQLMSDENLETLFVKKLKI